MSEQRWGLFYSFRRWNGLRGCHDAHFGWAEQNPAERTWTTTLDVRFATLFPSADSARSALTGARPQLHEAVWHIPLDAWTLKRVGDVGEPLTRYHEERPAMDAVTA